MKTAPRFIVKLLLASAVFATTDTALGAEHYPSRPIRIVTAEPGGGNDFVARQVARAVSGSIGQQVIVDNRGGAGGGRAAQTVSVASPDGYTTLLYSSVVWINPLLRGEAGYDLGKDFLPITVAAAQPNILVVHATLPVKSVKELIALAKSKPGNINYGASTGASTHLSAELFKAMAGVNIVYIGYKGTGPAITALVGNEVQMMFATASSMTPHVNSGRLRALAVTSAQPTALAPGLPTVASAGLPGYVAETVYGMFAPPKTPATLVATLNREIVRAITGSEAKERFFNAGAEVVANSPELATTAVKADVALWAKVIKDAGIRAD